MYECMDSHISTHTRTRVHTCMHTYTHEDRSTQIYMHIRVCTHILVCTSKPMIDDMYLCVHAYVYTKPT